jgi:ribosomal-protein-serine acetyltransferase
MDPRPLEPPPLRDGDLVLRPLHEGDAEAYSGAFVEDPDLARLLGFEELPTPDGVRASLTGIEEARREGRRLVLAVADVATDAFLGELVLHSFAWRHDRTEVAFWLVPGARGRGIAHRSVSLLLDWAFAELAIVRVEITTLPDNAPTRALARRLGFTEEGTMRRRNFERGVRVDVVMYGLLREDWRAG